MAIMTTLTHALKRSALPVCIGLAAAFASPAFAQKVKLVTTAGDIVIELDAAKAPKSVENFVGYVKGGHYDGTVFHQIGRAHV